MPPSFLKITWSSLNKKLFIPPNSSTITALGAISEGLNMVTIANKQIHFNLNFLISILEISHFIKKSENFSSGIILDFSLGILVHDLTMPDTNCLINTSLVMSFLRRAVYTCANDASKQLIIDKGLSLSEEILIKHSANMLVLAGGKSSFNLSHISFTFPIYTL